MKPLSMQVVQAVPLGALTCQRVPSCFPARFKLVGCSCGWVAVRLERHTMVTPRWLLRWCTRSQLCRFESRLRRWTIVHVDSNRNYLDGINDELS